MNLKLEAVTTKNLDIYQGFEEKFSENLHQYLTRFRPRCHEEAAAMKAAGRLAWYYICVDERPIGAVWMEKFEKDDEARMGIFIADPADRGKSLGEKSIFAFLRSEEVAAMYVKIVWLYVRKSNSRAMHCYKNCGFERAAAAEEDGIPMWRMERVQR